MSGLQECSSLQPIFTYLPDWRGVLSEGAYVEVRNDSAEGKALVGRVFDTVWPEVSESLKAEYAKRWNKELQRQFKEIREAEGKPALSRAPHTFGKRAASPQAPRALSF